MIGATSAGQVRVAMALISEVFWRGSQYRQATNGHHQRAADPLQDTHGDKGIHLGGKAAKNRGQGKDSQGESENSAGAEAIGDPAAGRDQYREGDQVGADTDIQFDCANTKIPGHIGQGGGDHRPVEKLHKKAPATNSAGAEKHVRSWKRSR